MLGLQGTALHSQEESFAAVLLSAITGRAEADAEADAILRRALQLARDAGYLQAQAQVLIPHSAAAADATFRSPERLAWSLQCFQLP